MKKEDKIKKAVALKYDRGKEAAPKVTAKGRGAVADKILALAREHKIPIEKDGQDYRLHFDMETDALGLIESTVLRTKAGVSVEISSALEEVVDLLKAHMKDLGKSLEPFGVIGIEIMQKKPVTAQRAAVDVVV